MKSKLRIVQTIALIVSVIVTVWAMLLAAAGQINSAAVALIGLAISPYLALYVVAALLDRYTSLPKNRLVSCVAAILMLAFTLLVYIGAAINSDSSTDALVFLFVPVWLYIGGFAVMLAGLLAAWLVEKIGGNR